MAYNLFAVRWNTQISKIPTDCRSTDAKMKVFENQLTDVPRKTYHPRKSERKFYAENQYPKFQYMMTRFLEPQEGCVVITLDE